MTHSSRSRWFWGLCLAGIITAGILSRVSRSGFPLLDKYLGDALYAAMVYAMLRLWNTTAPVAVWAAAIMTAIELFQLTMIPAHMLTSTHAIVRICARLMGTQFSFLDLLAYAVGIACMYVFDIHGNSREGSTNVKSRQPLR